LYGLLEFIGPEVSLDVEKDFQADDDVIQLIVNDPAKFIVTLANMNDVVNIYTCIKTIKKHTTK